jgi:tight adherence protein B
MQLLLAGLVFFMILLVAGGILTFVGVERHGEIIRGRLEAIEKGTAFGKEALNLDLVRDELLSTIPTVNKMLLRWSWPTRLRTFVAQAGMKVRTGTLVLITAILALAAFEVTRFVYHDYVVVAVAAAVVFGLLPLAFVAFKRARRMAAFQRQFPEVIDLLSRSVRAGHSFSSGMEIVATDLPEPAAGEFRTVFDEQRFGLPLRDALLGLCDRVPLVDVRLFVIALLVQKETGGNLVEILNNLSHVIRERFKIAGEVRIRTAQGRLTAIILTILPVMMLVLLHMANRQYLDVLFVDRMGQIMLVTAFAMQVVGTLIIWKIVNVKV